MILTNKETIIIMKIRELYADEMAQAGFVESLSKKITYEDGHVFELVWHKQDPDA